MEIKNMTKKSLEERVEKLEFQLSEILRILKIQQEQSKAPEQRSKEISDKRQIAQGNKEKYTPITSSVFPTAEKVFALPPQMRSFEFWLNKIGIALLLFGVAFLFKYSVDQGWLTPWIRVLFGLLVGILLVIFGFKIHHKKRHFAQVLFGGGIATFYITGFAAFQVLDLISHPIAFSFMIIVTFLSFVLSLKQNEAVLSIIGAIGGLGTPFLLYTGESNLPGLIGYTCLILAGTSAIYFYRSWRSLLFTSVIGGWLVIWVAMLSVAPFNQETVLLNKIYLQLGFCACWIFFWLIPLIRFLLAEKKSERWKIPEITLIKKYFSPHLWQTVDKPIYLLTVSTPLIVISLSKIVWQLETVKWGYIVLAFSCIYAAISWFLIKKMNQENVGFTHVYVFLLLFTYSLFLFFKGNSLLFVLAGEAAILHLLTKKNSKKAFSIYAHLLFFIAGFWLLQRLNHPGVGVSFFNLQALTDLWVILILFFVGYIFASNTEKAIYQIYAYLAFLLLIYRELVDLNYGQGFISVAWGTIGILLLIFSLRMNNKQLRQVAMATLFLVVGKLFLVDLSALDTIWRVLLFLGFGVIFMLISYFFQKLLKAK
jgi:uncharacterized membrane protein